MNISTENILVALPEQTVARLMNLRRFPSERVADIVKRLTVSVSDGPNAKGRDETSINLSGGRGRYVLRVLGESKVVGVESGRGRNRIISFSASLFREALNNTF